MLLTTKVGAAMAAMAAASFVAGASITPSSHVPRLDEWPSVTAPVVARGGKQDRLDIDLRPNPQRLACLSQDWLRLSRDCVDLFTAAAQAPTSVRTTTVIVQDGPGSSIAIRVPRPESEAASH
jgi:hypothetical protein